VAISYYAINLVAYLLAPLSEPLGISKTTLTAAAVIPVIGLVWFVINRLRRHIE